MKIWIILHLQLYTHNINKFYFLLHFKYDVYLN